VSDDEFGPAEFFLPTDDGGNEQLSGGVAWRFHHKYSPRAATAALFDRLPLCWDDCGTVEPKEDEAGLWPSLPCQQKGEEKHVCARCRWVYRGQGVPRERCGLCTHYPGGGERFGVSQCYGPHGGAMERSVWPNAWPCTHYQRVSPVDVGGVGEHLTDMGNARRYAIRFGDDVRYCTRWGEWMVWNGVCWRIDDVDGVVGLAKNVINDIYVEAAQASEKDERKRISNWAVQSENNHRVKAMLELTRSEPMIPVRPEQLDIDPMLMACANGVIDLRTGVLREGRRDDLITKQSPVKYDPDARCPTWMGFLEAVLPLVEVRGYLQRAIGYSLTGEQSEQAVFILYGTGSNGKSTFLEAVKNIMGKYAQQTPFSTFLEGPGGAIRDDIARLRGARFVSSTEVNIGKSMDEVVIKQMSGGDTIAARPLYGKYFEFRATFKVFLGVNHKPVIRGTDHAIWRRLKLIPFTVTIPEEEQDKKLKEKLCAELPGILNWAISGCLEWQKRGGLDEPPAVRIATAEYREDMDILGEFIKDRCALDPGLWVLSRELYDNYTTWCEETGNQPVSKRTFGIRLEERGLRKNRTKKNRGWFGIAITSEITLSNMVDKHEEVNNKRLNGDASDACTPDSVTFPHEADTKKVSEYGCNASLASPSDNGTEEIALKRAREIAVENYKTMGGTYPSIKILARKTCKAVPGLQTGDYDRIARHTLITLQGTPTPTSEKKNDKTKGE